MACCHLMGEQRDVPARLRVHAAWLLVQEESSTSPAAQGDSIRHHGQDVWASGLLELVCPLVWWGGHVWSRDPHILQTIVSPGPEPLPWACSEPSTQPPPPKGQSGAAQGAVGGPRPPGSIWTEGQVRGTTGPWAPSGPWCPVTPPEPGC